MVINQKQYRILEGLAACAKVGAKTCEPEKTIAYYQDMSGRHQLFAQKADAADIPFSIQNLTYYFGQIYPYEYNSRTIERALRRMNGDNFIVEYSGYPYTIHGGQLRRIDGTLPAIS